MATVSIKQARTLYTTFEILHERNACKSKYKYLAKKLGGIKKYGRTTPIPITKLYEICGPWDLGWAFNAVCFEPLILAYKIRICLARRCDGTRTFRDNGIWLMDSEAANKQITLFKEWFGK